MNPAAAPTHVAFSDESRHNEGRYRAVALITMPVNLVTPLSGTLRAILKESAVSEFKWSELRTARERFAAEKFVACLIAHSVQGQLRIDVLTWDTEDSRHRILGRNDVRNLRRMYYFLMKDVLGKRWPSGSIWRFRPDENTSIDWERIQVYLSEIHEWGTGELLTKIVITDFAEARSHMEPLVQAADLFAGLGIYSRERFDRYKAWRAGMVQEEKSGADLRKVRIAGLSNADHQRCALLAYFDTKCKSLKLGVSLQNRRGLRTFNPARSLNFWWYEPQGDYDKAPT